jgi:APA family basic amino acid/polyamine antiporter
MNRFTVRRNPLAMSQGFLERLFRKTSVEVMRSREEHHTLKRVLTGRDLIAIGLGTMIGGGIFATIGTGVHKAGPAVIVAFVLAGLASLLAALCYAELGAVIPSAGSAYTFSYATLGQVVGWVIGWNLILEYAISAAPVAQQFSQSLQEALRALWGWNPPPVLAKAVLAHPGGVWWQVEWGKSSIDLIGSAFVLLLTVLIILGIKETARANNVLVLIKVSALLVFIVAGAALFRPENLAHFNPVGWIGPWDKDGIPTGIFGAAALVFFVYIGFDAATTTAEECKNPPRDIPVGVIGSLLIGTALYCAVAVVLVGAVPWQQVNIDTPLQSALVPLHLPWAEWVIRIGVLAGTSSVALISLLGQSRIFFAMARDRMLPPAVASIHPRFRTPAKMSAITGIVVAAFTLIIPLDILLSLVNIGTMSAFVAVSLGVMVLRVARPELPRPFRTPLVWVTAPVGIAITGLLAVLGLGPITWIWFGGWLLLGLIFYFAYGFRQPPTEADVPSVPTLS